MGGGGGPLLYRELRLEGSLTATGALRGTRYRLVLQGRGNNCLNAGDLRAWHLDVSGGAALLAVRHVSLAAIWKHKGPMDRRPPYEAYAAIMATFAGGLAAAGVAEPAARPRPAVPERARPDRPRRGVVQGRAHARRDEVTSFIREPFVRGHAHEGDEEPVAHRRPPPGDRRARHLQPLRRHLGRRRAGDDPGARSALRPAADLVARRGRDQRLPAGRVRRAREQGERAAGARGRLGGLEHDDRDLPASSSSGTRRRPDRARPSAPRAARVPPPRRRGRARGGARSRPAPRASPPWRLWYQAGCFGAPPTEAIST